MILILPPRINRKFKLCISFKATVSFYLRIFESEVETDYISQFHVSLLL